MKNFDNFRNMFVICCHLNGDDERLADFRLKCHPHLHAVLPGFD